MLWRKEEMKVSVTEYKCVSDREAETDGTREAVRRIQPSKAKSREPTRGEAERAGRVE